MTKFLQKKDVFLIEYKYIWFFRQKNIEYKNVFLQHFSSHTRPIVNCKIRPILFRNVGRLYMFLAIPAAYSETSQTPKMKFFAQLV